KIQACYQPRGWPLCAVSARVCVSVCVCVCVCLSPRGVFRFCKGECMRGLLSGGKESSQAVHMLKGPLFSSPLFCRHFSFPLPLCVSLSRFISLPPFSLSLSLFLSRF